MAAAQQKLSQSEAQSKLEAAGITSYSSGGCTNRQVKTCTSYDQVNAVTVNGAITLKNACKCSLVITGGTEIGHASGQYSHYNGYKFDFRKDTGINNYVTGHFQKIEDRGDGYPQWKAASGNIYCVSSLHLGV